MKKLILLFSLVISFKVFAGGDRVGNGGDVVVCGDQVELLDLYEARTKGFKLITIDEDYPHDELIKLLEKKLKPLQTMRATRYKMHAENFFSEAQMLSGIYLNDIDDSGLVAIPAGCSLEQIVIQLADRDIQPDGYRYTVNKDLWEKLDGLNKMALMLHEIIYREVIENNSGSSMVVRGMVGQLLKDQMDLELFLKQSSKISSLVEFYDSIIQANDQALTFKKVVTERGVTAIETTSLDSRKNLYFYVRHADYFEDQNKKFMSGKTAQFECSSGKLLLLLDYGGREEGRMVYPNEPYEWKRENYITTSRPVFIKKDSNIFLGNEEVVDLEFQSEKGKSFLKNVKSISMLIGVPSSRPYGVTF